MYKKTIMIFLTVLLPALATEYIGDYQEFEILNPESTRNIIGNFTMIGNTVEAVTKCKRITDKNDINNCEIADKDNTKYYDNKYMTRFIYPDRSSTAYLQVPTNTRKIIWATLVWQGHINNYTYQQSNTSKTDDEGYDYYYYGSFDVTEIDGSRKVLFHYWRAGDDSYYYEISNDLPDNESDGIMKTSANQVNLKIDDTVFDVSADKLYYKGDTRYFCNIPGDWCSDDLDEYEKRKGVKYSAYKVLSEEQIAKLNEHLDEAKQNGIPITISNLTSSWGQEARLGDYGAWTLVVIYESYDDNSESKLKNVSIFSGFKSLPKSEVHDMELEIEHLVLPRNGEIKSLLAIFTAEGEKSLTGDYIELNDELLTEPNADADNIFDSYLSDNISRSPKLENNNGIDIDIFDSSAPMEKLRDSDPDAEDYTAKIKVHSYPDGIFISIIAFATDLYKPRVCYYIDKIADAIDGEVYFENGKFIKNIDLKNEYNISFMFANMKEDSEDNIEEAEKVVIYIDYNDTAYLPRTTYLKNPYADWKYITDAEGDDEGEFLSDTNVTRLRVGIGADSTTGGTFPPVENSDVDPDKVSFANLLVKFQYNETNESSISFDLKQRLKFQATFQIANIGIDIDKAIPIPECMPMETNSTITLPKPSYYNIIEPTSTIVDNKDPLSQDDPVNKIYTKVVDTPFDMKLIHLKEDKVTLADITNYVQLETVETNESCEQTRKIEFVNLAKFSNSTLAQYLYPVESANPLILKNINKNTLFRIRYVDWDEAIVHANIRCKVSSMEKKIKGVPACVYFRKRKFLKVFPNSPCVSDYGEPCLRENEGKGTEPYDDDYGCLRCIMDHHAKSACSRDNFAIRPYGFVLFSDNYLKRSGEDINITIKAVNENNFSLSTGDMFTVKSLKDYNESLSSLNINASIYAPTPSEVYQMNKDVYGIEDYNASRVAHCPNNGTLTPTLSSFADGELNTTMQYSESGIIEMNVSEKPGHEYALVDVNDTPDSQRYIKPATFITDKDDIGQRNLMIFIPYQFTTQAVHGTSTGSNWLYMSNEVRNANIMGNTPQMATFVKYHIIAQNKSGATLQNYTRTCFPDTDETNAPRRNGLKLNSTFDLFLDLKFDIDKNCSMSFYTEDNTSTPIWTLTTQFEADKERNNSVQEWISPLNFETGIGEAVVHFNIDRNRSKPINPTKITLLEINTSTSWMDNTGATKIFNGVTPNAVYNFYYGRLHIPTQKIEYKDDREGVINTFYEIYMNDGGTDYASIKGKTSIDDIYWYQNLGHTGLDGNITTPDNTIIDDNGRIQLRQKFPVANAKQKIKLRYLDITYPYANTIALDTQSWLLFDKFDPTVSKVFGRVVFTRPGGWLGRGKDFSSDDEFSPSKHENTKIIW